MKKQCRRWSGQGARQKGSSLIEVMFAMFILAIGILGSLVLILSAMGANARSSQDTNATMLTQSVMAQVLSASANSSPTLSVTDCGGVSHGIATLGAAPPGIGAKLNGNGHVDFSQTRGGPGSPPNYYMLYKTCGVKEGQKTYDVRWNIQTLSTHTKLVTVSAKLADVNNDNRYFALPVTMQTIAGPLP